MAEEPLSVEAEAPAEVSQPEQNVHEEAVTIEAKEPVVENQDPAEPVDDKGVPIRNRVAEAQRKAKKLTEAERTLADPSSSSQDADKQALEIVERIAEKKVMDRIAPILARQFLIENPEAADMIDEINKVREENPELSSIDKLDLAYKIAKADRQDEIIRKRVENETRETQDTLQRAGKAAAQGIGKVPAPQQSLADKMASAGSLAELQELESMLSK